MNNLTIYFISFFLIFTVNKGIVQSPIDLTEDVDLTPCGNDCTLFPPNGFFGSESQIENAFNFARRFEEDELGLAPNSLGNLVLPSDYSTLSVEERGLFLINAEREARSGLTYGGQNVLGLPLEALEDNLNIIAQGHTVDMVENNFFGHIGSDGQNPFQRINNSETYGPSGVCTDFMSYSENLYSSCGGSDEFLVAQAMFSFIYQDAISNWGHRRAILIQNFDSYGAIGFENNFGDSGSEGFLGLATGSRGPGEGTSFGYCPTSLPAFVLTMNIVDPTDDPSCDYELSLPVDLLSFEYSILDCNSIRFEWITANEVNHSHFNVQRTSTGKDWQSSGIVSTFDYSKAGLNYYSHIERNFKSGEYFRLAQVDIGGNYKIHWNIRVVNDCDTDDLFLFPNPASTVVNIGGNFEFSGQEYILYSVQGKKILQGEVSENPIDLSEVPDGIYFMSINGKIKKLAIAR